MENYTDLNELKNEIKKMKKQNHIYRMCFMLMVLIVFAFGFTKNPENYFETLRVRELIVEDAKGMDRIILSPEIAQSKTRIRKDTLEGVLILNEHGHDQVLLGKAATAQHNGKIFTRIKNEAPYGFFMNDITGNERGGICYYNERKLATVGLDNRSGEGAHIISSDSGIYGMNSGMFVQSGSGNTLFVGESSDRSMLISLNGEKLKTKYYLDSRGKSALSLQQNDGTEKIILKIK